ncbi:tyrosine-type recombinase/integrase [Nocardia xishanensis]|uniref:Tyrosine-type recombinase/integrase n=1 Tax=Nocardia xishanensis TaxID=238964 RepID=A0ABW7X9K0_9NOCA
MKSDDVSTALHLIGRLGLTLDDLAVASTASAPTPTFHAFLARLRSAVPPSTLQSYGTYWRIIEAQWGDRLLDEPSPTEISVMVEDHRQRAVVRTNSRGGHGATRMFIAAFRCLYKHAERDGLIHPLRNPAAKVDKPRQLPSPRHALSLRQIEDLAQVAASTGDDPDLDALIMRLHIETACRRGGALHLRVDGLDHEDCLVLLREKGGNLRWQPVSPTLMRYLALHVETRGGIEATSAVLRYRTGRPVGRRRYNYLRERFHHHLPWAATLGVTAHWVRHTTLTFVEREFGYAVARAFAGHADSGGGRASTTHTYVRATLAEVAEAVEALTGEPHPLARRHRHPLAPGR